MAGVLLEESGVSVAGACGLLSACCAGFVLCLDAVAPLACCLEVVGVDGFSSCLA